MKTTTKSISVIVLSLVITISCYSQTDTIIYLGANNKPSDKEHAHTFLELTKMSENQYNLSEFQKRDDNWKPNYTNKINVINDSTLRMTMYRNGEQQSVMYRKASKKEDGFYHFKDFYKDGTLNEEGKSVNLFPLFREGQIKRYYDNGELAQLAFFKKNQMVSNQNWNKDGSKYLDNIFYNAEVRPEFPGGDEELSKVISQKMVYPEEARQNGIYGRVYVQFVITEDGNMDGVRVIRGVAPVLDEAAIQIIKSINTKWKPGYIDGKKVRVAYGVPINFVLN
jgi:TonB family protein